MAPKKTDKKPKFWIKDVVEKGKGGLHKSLGVPENKPIPKAKIEAAAAKGGKVGKQARLALVLAKFSKGKKK